jgi:hypothetical protein
MNKKLHSSFPITTPFNSDLSHHHPLCPAHALFHHPVLARHHPGHPDHLLCPQHRGLLVLLHGFRADRHPGDAVVDVAVVLVQDR